MVSAAGDIRSVGLDGADAAIDAAAAAPESACAKFAGPETAATIAEAHERVQLERAARVARLMADFPAAMGSADAAFLQADEALIRRDAPTAAAVLAGTTAFLLPYHAVTPAPDGYAARVVAAKDRSLHTNAISALANGGTSVASRRYADAENSYRVGVDALRQVSAQYAAQVSVTQLQTDLDGALERVGPRANAERERQLAIAAKEARASLAAQARADKAAAAEKARSDKAAAETAALMQVCGEKPVIGAWDGELSAVNRYVQAVVSDPDVDVENCTQPVLTDHCWRSSCEVIGKNVFNATVRQRQTFLIAKNSVIGTE